MKRYKEVADSFFNRIENHATSSGDKMEFYRNELNKWGSYADRMETKYLNSGKCSNKRECNFVAAYYVANRVRFGVQCCLVNLQLDRMEQDRKKGVEDILHWRVDI